LIFSEPLASASTDLIEASAVTSLSEVNVSDDKSTPTVIDIKEVKNLHEESKKSTEIMPIKEKW